MGAKTLIRGVVNEDGSFSVLGRVCSLDGSGDEYGEGEGNVLQQADVSAITCKVFDLGTDEAATGTAVSPDPTVTISTSVFDTLRTVGWPTDRVGYNFRHDLGPTYTADPGEYRRAEYKFTLTDGSVFFVNALLLTKAVSTS